MLPSCRRPLVVLAALLVALTALGTSGCASERKPIDKVQANALAKSFFVGNPGDPSDDPEFYARNFVVDASEAQELVGIGSWSGVDRIKWEISENTLFARRSYGQNQGADDKGATSSFPNGTIVAAYKIDKHFDIRRDYNPQTGEDLNVVVENDTDRPWYERDYFRVDWSQNTVNSPGWEDLFIGKLVGELKVTPVSYYVSDPNQDDAPHFDTAGGYFDITSKFTVEPTQSQYGFWPQCAVLGFVTGTAIQNCDAQEAVIRSSYWRVSASDPDGDFEPFVNTLAPQDIIGNPGGQGGSVEVGLVTPPRASYDPGYGYTDVGLKRFMHIHNVWKQSHQTRGTCTTDGDCTRVTGIDGSTCLPSGTCTIPCSYDARRDGNGDGTEDQCDAKRTRYRGSLGAQCSAKNRCTIPYRDREIKPIPWWVNQDMPGALQDQFDSGGKRTAVGPTEDVVFTWNQALQLAIAHAREVECRRTGGQRADCHRKFFDDGSAMLSYGGWGIEKVKDGTDVAITCHNPVRTYDAAECGVPNTVARVGDVRRNFIFYWQFASRAPWGGIANWNGDPLTGQMIGAAATIMGRSVTQPAAQIRDVLEVANGELQMKDITDGTPAVFYQRTLQLGQKPTTLSADEIARRIAGIDLTNAAGRLGIASPASAAAPTSGLGPFYTMMTHTSADPALLANGFAELDGIVKPLLGTRYETRLVSPSWLVDAAGLDPASTLDDATLARVSPLRGRDPAKTSLMLSTTLAGMSSHGVCLFAPGDAVGNPDVRGVARWFGASDIGKYGNDALKRDHPELRRANLVTLQDARANLIYEHLTKETYQGIALHEVGHALGMFHNFASSFDATNFNPQYWQLRTNEGAAAASCGGTPRAPGNDDTCMGPRFLDPETDDELGQADESRPGINYFGHTSTMEYQGERFFETVGMGQYDVMTMGALYGRVLETFDAQATDGSPYEYLDASQLIADNLVVWTPPLARPGLNPMHYTELARQIGLYDASRCRPATAGEIAHAEWRIVHQQVCSPPPKDHAAWDAASSSSGIAGDFEDGAGTKSTVSSAAFGGGEGAGNVRWPYRFGQTNNAYTHINPFDIGADLYEVTREAVKAFDYSYPFRYFRRKRSDYDYDSLPSIAANRFFERLRSYHWEATISNARGPNVAPDSLAQFQATDDVARGNALAEHDMVQAIVRTIVMPQIGEIGEADPSLALGQTHPLFDALSGNVGASAVSLDASNARFVDADFDTGPRGGGSWNYLNYINHAGFDVEKSYAALSLTDPRPTLAIIQRDTYIDGRHLYVSFRTDMAKTVDRALGGILSNDWETVAEYLPLGAQNPEPLDLTVAAPARAGSAADNQLLFPNLGYLQQLGAVVWTELFSRLGTDLTLANKVLMYTEGTVGVIDIPDAQKTKFTDPRSGFTYVARLFGPDTIDGKTVDSGIASRMLAHANDLVTLAYQVDLDSSGKPALDGFGRPTVLTDAAAQPLPTTSTVAAQGLADYVGLLDATVQIAAIVGHGPL